MENMILIEELDGMQRELAEVIGIDAYNKLVQYAAGSAIYIPTHKIFLRNRSIRAEFDGGNHMALARTHGLSVAQIRRIVAPESGVVPGQLSIFDE